MRSIPKRRRHCGPGVKKWLASASRQQTHASPTTESRGPGDWCPCRGIEPGSAANQTAALTLSYEGRGVFMPETTSAGERSFNRRLGSKVNLPQMADTGEGRPVQGQAALLPAGR